MCGDREHHMEIQCVCGEIHEIVVTIREPSVRLMEASNGEQTTSQEFEMSGASIKIELLSDLDRP